MPWFERVSSKDNPSDGISRGDAALAVELGWRYLPLDCSRVYALLVEAVDADSFDVVPLLHVILADFEAQLVNLNLPKPRVW